ncbi:MAG: RNase III inhibitor [Clostridiales bacterium]|nr:RNase III inhibitor [Clostridiales bacterium]
MPFTIIRNDITKMKVDAIVNAANTKLLMGGGVCGAIFKAAGEAKLRFACDKLSPIKIGEAVITPGFSLPAKYIIHTAGPVYRGGKQGEEELLRSCYINSLKRAVENKCESIAFPLISSGIYGYPKRDALRVATVAIKDFLQDHDMDISLVVFDKEAFVISQDLLGEVEAFIDENYIEDFEDLQTSRRLLNAEVDAIKLMDASRVVYGESERISHSGIDRLVGNLDEPFAATLFRLIDAKGMTDVEVYKRANLDRRLFSKIRNKKDYMPSKRTAIALAVALELTLDETDDLLRRAGYALSESQKFDVIIQYFIINRKYDIFEINEVLFNYDQPLLGG